MNKKLYALALTIAVVGSLAGQAKAQLPEQSSTGDASPNLEESFLISGSNLTNTETETETTTQVWDNDTTTTTATSDDDVITKTETETTATTDSYNTQHTEGSQSPALQDSAITNSDFEDVKQQTAGAWSPNLNDDSTITDSNFATLHSAGPVSPNLQDSLIDRSNLANQYSTGALSPNMQDATIENSDLVNGAQDNSYASHNSNTQTGQVNVNSVDSEVEIGNVASDYATILDGDIDTEVISLLLGGEPGSTTPGLGGESEYTVSVNTGIMKDSIMGNENAQMNYTGVGINGGFEAEDGSGSSSINNSQNSNLSIFGGTP